MSARQKAREAVPAAPVEFKLLRVELLRESEHNPRRRMNDEALEALAESIRAQGVLAPLLVRPAGDVFEIAAGHRRFRAAIAAGLREVPALVRNMTDVEMLETLVVDNEHREDVHPLDQAEGYRSLQAAGYSIARIAERVGRPRMHVETFLGLRRLRQEAQDHFLEGEIHLSHAKLIAPLSAEDQSRVLAACEKPWSDGGLLDDSAEPPGARSEGARPLVSTRRMASWIEGHIPLDLDRIDAHWGAPRLAAAMAEAEKRGGKYVQITRLSNLPDEAKGRRVLAARSWKRADGSELEGAAEACEVAVLGVVVLGPGRGEAFDVCVDRLCDTHWGQDAVSREESGAARQERAKQQELEQKEAARVVAAFSRAIFTKVATRSARFVRDHLVAQLDETGRALFDQAAPKGKFWRDVSALTQQAALAIVVAAATGHGSAEELPAIGEALGVGTARPGGGREGRRP